MTLLQLTPSNPTQELTPTCKWFWKTTWTLNTLAQCISVHQD